MIIFSENGQAELMKAFIAAQSEMDGAKKTANNPHFKSKYADLAAVCDAVMEALTKHEIGVVQSPSYDDNGVHVQTMFIHSGGGYMHDTLSMKPAKLDPQGLGSCITYARRYALAAMCGIAPEDDDGNAASNLNGGGRPQQQQKPTIMETAKAKLEAAHDMEELNKRRDFFMARDDVEKVELGKLYEANKTRLNGRKEAA